MRFVNALSFLAFHWAHNYAEYLMYSNNLILT